MLGNYSDAMGTGYVIRNVPYSTLVFFFFKCQCTKSTVVTRLEQEREIVVLEGI